MKTVYTAIGDDLNDLIDTLVEEKGVKKGDIVRELLEKGLQADQLLLEAEQMKDKVLDVETVRETMLELNQRHTDDLKKIDEAIDQMFKTLTEEIRKVSERPDLLSVEDAKILYNHLKTCTDPKCPYKEVFPEVERTEEQTRPEATETPGAEHKPPERWCISDVCRTPD